eukprot:TRINITY_DN26811_c0_g1_i1.p1 TRINITY_DN26811_c0_g1~~TRINITY_DN26811_c0_g1_i1.p1  ORF type:complete len:442 (-),score=36.93 TRINITY_DN26811_c0_g1_i1:322-1647(-)
MEDLTDVAYPRPWLTVFDITLPPLPKDAFPEYPVLHFRDVVSVPTALCVAITFLGGDASYFFCEHGPCKIFCLVLYQLPTLFGACWAIQEMGGGCPEGTASLVSLLVVPAVVYAAHMHSAWDAALLYVPIVIGGFLVPVAVAHRRALLIGCALLMMALWTLIQLFMMVQQSMTNSMDGVGTGLLSPVVMVLFEKVGWLLFCRLLWRNYHGNAPPLLLSFFAGFIVTGGEALRLNNLLTAMHRHSVNARAGQVLSSVLSGALIDAGKRLKGHKVVLSKLCSMGVFSVTPEDDTLLRTRLGLGYVPPWAVLLALHQRVFIKCDRDNLQLCITVVMASLLGQFVADLVVLAAEHYMTEKSVPLTPGHWVSAWKRLLKPGSHGALQQRFVSGNREPPAPLVSVNPDSAPGVWGATPESICGACMVLVALEFVEQPTLSLMCPLQF